MSIDRKTIDDVTEVHYSLFKLRTGSSSWIAQLESKAFKRIETAYSLITEIWNNEGYKIKKITLTLSIYSNYISIDIGIERYTDRQSYNAIV